MATSDQAVIFKLVLDAGVVLVTVLLMLAVGLVSYAAPTTARHPDSWQARFLLFDSNQPVATGRA